MSKKLTVEETTATTEEKKPRKIVLSFNEEDEIEIDDSDDDGDLFEDDSDSVDTDLDDTEEHEPLSFDKPYEPAKEDPTVHKTIEILNELCKKYKYAMLMKHEVISDDSMNFYIDYHFNGKEVGMVSLEMDKQTSGRWTCRCYLSVVRAAKLPMTNVAMFICDFKRIIQSLHIAVGETAKR
jgi:hypothetical protein